MTTLHSVSEFRWRLRFFLAFACVLIGTAMFFPQAADAATVTWDGGGADGTCGGAAGDGNKWSCGLNWSTDSVPTSADVATFNSTSTKDVTIDSAQTITTLTMTTGYTGTMTQAANLTITTNFTHDSTDGTFTWSSGTLIFSGATGTWNVDTDDTFGHVTIDKSSQLTITSGDTAIVSGTLTLTNGIIQTGTLEARGDISHGAGFDGGTGTLNITQGSSAINLTAAGQLPVTTLSANRTINGNSSGTVTFDGLFTMSAGTFVGGAGDLTLSGGLALSGTASFTAPSGTMSLASTYTRSDSTTVNYNSGTILIASTTSVDLSTTETINSLSISASFTIPSGETIVVPGTLTLTNSNIVVGTVEARGEIVHTAGFDGGTGTLNITAGTSDITLVGAGQLPRTTLSADREIIGPSSGQVIFDNLFTLAAGAYTGGAGDLWFLQGLTVSGGTFHGGSGTIDVQTTLTISGASTSFTSTSGTMTIGANWSHTDASTYAHNSGTVTFDGTTQSIDVNTSETFYNLNFTVAGTKTIASGDSLITTGSLTLSDGSINTGTLEPQGSVTVGAAYDGGTSPLTFSGSATQTFTLTGATGLYNGDINVNKSGGQVNLASALVMDAASQDLAIQEGKLSLAAQNLTVNGSGGTVVVEDGGNLQLQGSETTTLNASNPTFNSGSTVTFVGDGDAVSDIYTVTSLASTYHHLVINAADGATDTFQLGAALDVNGNLTITAGTFDVTASNYAINLAGNWSNAGTVNMRSNTVTLDGADQTISGSSTFYVLSKQVSSAATLTLPASGTQTVTGELILTGTSGQLLSLRSSSSGTKAMLDPQGSRTVEYLNVQDNENISATNLSCTTGCVNAGNNVRWTFTQGSGVVYDTGPGFIPSITYTGPQDGVVLGANTEQEITWDADAFDGAYVNIAISYDGGLIFESLYVNIDNDGVEPWTVPDVSSDEVVIKVALTDLAVESAVDYSTPFRIEMTEGVVDTPEGTPTAPVDLVSEVKPGMYIRGVSFPDVYYVDADGYRRPFLNESIYFTYEDSWEGVAMVADDTLARYMIGKPMLPKPGTVLVKFESSPKVYWMSEGEGEGAVLHWIQSESIAETMFGQEWADYVIDVPPTFWTKFVFGSDIAKPFSIDLLLMKKRTELHE